MTTEEIIKEETDDALTSSGVNTAIKKNTDPENNEVVICDECGDRFWDEVLAQDNKKCILKHVCQISSTTEPTVLSQFDVSYLNNCHSKINNFQPEPVEGGFF
ncbi:MAG: hypothetical protein ABI402_11695 [Ferruginibacter sp.]